MKLMNPIEAECAGTVAEILVKDASPVEYDQHLIAIRPAGGAGGVS
jgi:acetyl-CoA carboxylase biotin carboxyl carrier protein